MKRKEKTMPMNISVPSSLKERMERHQEINWSATACRSFERQLKSQEALDELSEPGVSEEDALDRALRVQHAGTDTFEQLEINANKLLAEVNKLKGQRELLKQKPDSSR